MVPERRFAITSLTNCGPNGGEFNEEIMRWAFETYLEVDMSDPEPLRLDADALAPYVGRYETIAAIADISAGDGVLIVEVTVRPEVLEQLHEEPDDEPPIPIGICPATATGTSFPRPRQGDEGVLPAWRRRDDRRGASRRTARDPRQLAPTRQR